MMAKMAEINLLKTKESMIMQGELQIFSKQKFNIW